MNTKEKFNAIIYKIEDLVNDNVRDKKDIANKAFEAGKAPFMTEKERRNLFAFMTGMSVSQYITKRQMMRVYRKMLETDGPWKNLDKNELYDMSGVESQPAFISKFNKEFGMNPKEAFEQKDESVLAPPFTWEYISEENVDISLAAMEEKMKFGVPALKLVKAIAAQNMQNFYGLNDYESELAFSIAEETSFSYEDVFEYVYGYVWKYIDGDGDYLRNAWDISKKKVNEKKRDLRIETELKDKAVLRLYFELQFSLKDIRILIQSCEGNRETLETISQNECKRILSHYYEEEKRKEREEQEAIDEWEKNLREEYCEEPYIVYNPDTDDYEDEYGERCDPEDDWEYYVPHDYDLNDDRDYEEICEQTLKEMGYRGNPKRRLPGEYDYLFAEAEELEHCFEKNWATGESPFIEEFVDWFMEKENMPKNYCLLDI